MLAEIQVAPRPYGDDQDAYGFVHPALKLIQDSGLTYEVHALGTNVEGTPDQVWALLRAVHEAALEAGADSTASIIKIHQGATDDSGAENTPAMERLTKNWR